MDFDQNARQEEIAPLLTMPKKAASQPMGRDQNPIFEREAVIKEGISNYKVTDSDSKPPFAEE